MSAELGNDLDAIVIDEKREHVLTKLVKNKAGVKKVESDHNSIITKFRIQWKNQSEHKRIEIFNLKHVNKYFAEKPHPM